MQHKPIRVLLTLVAVLAMSALATAAAQAAAPEFKPATKQAFSGTGGALALQNNVDEEKLTCTASANKGEITGATTIGVTVLTFTGCKWTAGTESCSVKSTGAKEGEIVTNALAGELGTVKAAEATSGVGLLLKPASGQDWTPLIEGKCFSSRYIEGSVAAEVTPIKTSGKTLKLVFATAEVGVQKIHTITLNPDEAAKPKLGYPLEELSFANTSTLEFKSNALEVT
jgi:hypothetical protein